MNEYLNETNQGEEQARDDGFSFSFLGLKAFAGHGGGTVQQRAGFVSPELRKMSGLKTEM